MASVQTFKPHWLMSKAERLYVHGSIEMSHGSIPYKMKIVVLRNFQVLLTYEKEYLGLKSNRD